MNDLWTRGPLLIESIGVLRGANYFSWDPVVVLRLNLASYDEVFSQTIPGFNERLQSRLPTLVEHTCSEGVRGGFFMRLASGTLLGHVTEHVALELQIQAGIDVAFGKTRSTEVPGVYHVVFRYEDEAVGMRAAELATDLINSCLLDRDWDVAAAVEELRSQRARHMDPRVRALGEEAHRRGIPVLRLESKRGLLIGSGAYGRWYPYDPSAEVLVPDPPDLALDTWYPPGSPTHIPLIAVAGQGAVLAAELLGRCLGMDGRKVGWGSGEDPEQLSIWLLDPEIQALVIHVSLSTIVEQGLPYHRADVGVVLEAEGLAPAGHLRDQDDLAYALAVTVEEVRQAGAAILNADDPHVLDMAGRLYARPVFFTRDRQLRFVSEHITDGHLAVVLTGDRVTLEQRRDVQEVVRLGADGLPAADHPDSTVWLGVVAVLAGLGWTPWSIGQALRNVAARRCG